MRIILEIEIEEVLIKLTYLQDNKQDITVFTSEIDKRSTNGLGFPTRPTPAHKQNDYAMPN